MLKIYEKTGGMLRIMPSFEEYATGGQEKTICIYLKYDLEESKLSMALFRIVGTFLHFNKKKD